jgi:hypothetical protein
MIRVRILRSKEQVVERDINDCLSKFAPYPNCQIVSINSTYIVEKNIYQTIIIYDVS